MQQPSCDLCRQTTLSVSHCSGLELMFRAPKFYRIPSGIVFEPKKLYRDYYWECINTWNMPVTQQHTYAQQKEQGLKSSTTCMSTILKRARKSNTQT